MCNRRMVKLRGCGYAYGDNQQKFDNITKDVKSIHGQQLIYFNAGYCRCYISYMEYILVS